jgi:hypothetical protein
MSKEELEEGVKKVAAELLVSLQQGFVLLEKLVLCRHSMVCWTCMVNQGVVFASC